MEKWFIRRKGAPFEEIAEKFQIHPIIARLIRNRDVVGDEAIQLYLNGTITDLHDGMLMKDMDKAIDILMEKIQEDKKIRIIGDYDIDGVNATYILLEGIRALGGDVDYDIPERVKDGYGLNRALIAKALDDEVDTIITCDNGIAAAEEIAYGKKLGLTVIVTDHHDIPYEEVMGEKQYHIPLADAVIDPKQADCPYPFKGLCGAAVAYKLIEALLEAFGKDVEDIDYLMENVAIATVGDVMDLVGENRIFVKQGLEMLKRTENFGLKALLECTHVDVDQLSSYHIGFVLGPCLNASGRLDTAKRALELLCARDKQEADRLAGDLKAINDSRKEMTFQAVKDAIDEIESSSLKKDRVLVVYLPECHESLAGIVAGKIRERYNKPTYILTNVQEGVKGSGRSVEGYHMYEELNKCKNLLTKFGGHQLAVGLSLEEENVDTLRIMLNALCSLTEADLIPKVFIDMQMPFRYIDEAFIRELEILEPFGKGNVKPIFAEKDVEIISGRILGQKQNVLKMKVSDAAGTMLDAVYFGDIEKFLKFLETKYDQLSIDLMMRGEKTGMKMSCIYYPEMNDFMGKKTPQIIIQGYQE